MKKTYLFLTLLFSLSVYCQNNETSLSPIFKIEGFVDKIGLGYELPINNNLLLDLNAGYGGANIIQPNQISYKLGKDDDKSYGGIFLKGQLRYYLNREKRAAHNRSLKHNAGSFIGLQTKFNLNGNKAYTGKTLLTDIHFGQQLPIGNKFIFRHHLGIGYANNFDLKYNSLYPAVNLSFGYVIN